MSIDEVITMLRSDVTLTPADRVAAALELERVQAELVELETHVVIRPSESGESATRRVQGIASRALHGGGRRV